VRSAARFLRRFEPIAGTDFGVHVRELTDAGKIAVIQRKNITAPRFSGCRLLPNRHLTKPGMNQKDTFALSESVISLVLFASAWGHYRRGNRRMAAIWVSFGLLALLAGLLAVIRPGVR
jgi:hypothetical protein